MNLRRTKYVNKFPLYNFSNKFLVTRQAMKIFMFSFLPICLQAISSQNLSILSFCRANFSTQCTSLHIRTDGTKQWWETRKETHTEFRVRLHVAKVKFRPEWNRREIILVYMENSLQRFTPALDVNHTFVCLWPLYAVISVW